MTVLSEQQIEFLNSIKTQAVMAKDRHCIVRDLKKYRVGKLSSNEAHALYNRCVESIATFTKRQEALPKIKFPAELPVSQRESEIQKAIEENQVVVVCGETGSGKTTQLPKICINAGRGVSGMIGHTQPRRIAARSVAERIASELNEPIGQSVGYQVRFTDVGSRESIIKLMTDGILLAEIQNDRFLTKYDTIIIDEAHERSLNIDFLLGILKQLITRRRDLKVIITSATIDTDKFSKHFGDAPIIEVSGRLYPVTVKYQALEAGDDLPKGVLTALEQLPLHEGDALVFMPTERDILDAQRVIEKHGFQNTEVLPLFARMSNKLQHKIFEPGGRRRIVLATNIAETSVTVPGIRFVIDTGLARISRYSYRTKVQRIPVEEISQASAQQRAGRCGRVADGHCIRLYSEENFNDRPMYTEPEIQRTNLASVILKMKSLGLGEIQHFPFVDAPDNRFIKDGYTLLEELTALDKHKKLTKLGRSISRLAIEPRLARMLIAAKALGCLDDVLTIVSGIAIQDPRERPQDKQNKADERHRVDHDKRSDFMTLLNLWHRYLTETKNKSQSQTRQFCKQQFLSYIRMREWRDLRHQLAKQLRESGMVWQKSESDYDAIHQALIYGLLGHIATKDIPPTYEGARGVKLKIFPGSATAKASPKWIVAAELVETSQLFARVVGTIEPKWISIAAQHLVKRSYSEPHWVVNRGQVMAFEQQSLYGLTIITKKRVAYERIDPEESRKVFINQALVAEKIKGNAPFLKHNSQLIKSLEAQENKIRQHSILVDDTVIAKCYENIIPHDICGENKFHAWRKQAEKENPKILYFAEDDIRQQGALDSTEHSYPPTLAAGDLILPLKYSFAPGELDDGVSVIVPIAQLALISEEHLVWLVPGMLEEKIVAILKQIPKQTRKKLVPIPNTAKEINRSLQAQMRSDFLKQLSALVTRMIGDSYDIPSDTLENLDTHLKMNIKVVDEKGKLVAQGRQLALLKNKLDVQMKQNFSVRKKHEIERSDLSSWNFGDIPETITTNLSGQQVSAFPALVIQGGVVSIELKPTLEEANTSHNIAQVHLAMRQLSSQKKYLVKNIQDWSKMSLLFSPVGDVNVLREAIVFNAFERTFFSDGERVLLQSNFERRLSNYVSSLIENANAISKSILNLLTLHHDCKKALGKINSMAALNSVTDINSQLSKFVNTSMLADYSYAELKDIERYLTGVKKRIEKLKLHPAKDNSRLREITYYWNKIKELIKPGKPASNELRSAHWAIEEYRLSIFSQELGLAASISAKKVEEILEQV